MMVSKRNIFFIATILLLSFVTYTKLVPLYHQATARGTYAVAEPLPEKLRSYYNKIFLRSAIYEFLRKAYYTFGVERKGIIHIGARAAEELDIYLDFKIPQTLWIEADLEAEEILRKAVAKDPNSKVAMFAVADKNGTIILHQTSNEGHSSSVLPLKNHKLHYPSIVETKAFEVPAKRLDDYLTDAEKALYNVIVIDIQGGELIAFKGAVKTLKHIDAVVAEVNYDELYEGGVLMHDLDAFMFQHDFVRVDTISIAPYTGDALYVKKKFFHQLIK